MSKDIHIKIKVGLYSLLLQFVLLLATVLVNL